MTNPDYSREFEDEDAPGALDDVDLDDVDLDDVDPEPPRENRRRPEDDDAFAEDEDLFPDDDDDGDDRSDTARDDEILAAVSGRKSGSGGKGKPESGSYRYVCIPQSVTSGREMPKSEWQELWGGPDESDQWIRKQLRARSDHQCKWEVIVRVVRIVGGNRRPKDVDVRTVSTEGPEIEESVSRNHPAHPFEDEFDDEDEFPDDDLSIDDIAGEADITPSGRNGNGNGSSETKVITAMQGMLAQQQRSNMQMFREMMSRDRDREPAAAPAPEKESFVEKMEGIAAMVTAAMPLIEMFRSSRPSELDSIKTAMEIVRGANAPDWKQMLGMTAMTLTGQLAPGMIGAAAGGMPPGMPPGMQPGMPPALPPGTPPPGLPNHEAVPPAPAPTHAPPVTVVSSEPNPSPATTQTPPQPAPQADPQLAAPTPVPDASGNSLPAHLQPVPPPEMFADPTSVDYRHATLWRAMHEFASSPNAAAAMDPEYWRMKMTIEFPPESLSAFLEAWKASPESVAAEGLNAAPAVSNYVLTMLTDEQRANEAEARKMVALGFRNFLQEIVESIEKLYSQDQQNPPPA